MNYDDDWFWDEWQHEVPNDPVTDATKVFIFSAVLLAIALCAFFVGVL